MSKNESLELILPENIPIPVKTFTPLPFNTATPTEVKTITPWSKFHLRNLDDPFYMDVITNIITQYKKWEIEMGKDKSLEKVFDWMNGDIKELPCPEQVDEAVKDENNPSRIFIYFTDGMVFYFEVNRDYLLTK